jgi:branched-chain amino acid transport system substrate-binding protein
LGQTLASSGLVGASIGGLRTGLAVWAKDVNARGGVQCHPVEVTSLDDGSDPSRVAANWNTLVNVKGAVALLGVGTPVGSAALRSSAERDKVPVVGADLNAEDYFTSPYIFPQGGLPLTAYDGAYLMAAKQAGAGGTAGLIYCVEITICTGVKNNHIKAAGRAGLKLGPVQAASLTQPDYSAECQSMKQGGVTVLFLALDGSGSVRAARSCASVGFHPAIATSAIAVSAQAAADPTLRQAGLFLGTNNVPFMTDNPAAVEFRAAMTRYAPTALLEEQALFGWASGKLFEAALSKVADRARSGDVTTEMVLDGLWQLKNEKLGGLGPGVTFPRGKPAIAPDCFYGLKLGTDGFSAPIGANPVCFDKNGKAEGSGAPSSVAFHDPAAATAALPIERQRPGRRPARRRVRAEH